MPGRRAASAATVSAMVEVFGELLRQQRLGGKRGVLSQKTLARAIGLSASMVTLLESGERRPTREQILRIATVLVLSPVQTDELLLAGGHFPSAYDRTPPADEDLLLVADILGDEAISEEAKLRFRLAIRLAALQWRPDSLDVTALWKQLHQRPTSSEGQPG